MESIFKIKNNFKAFYLLSLLMEFSSEFLFLFKTFSNKFII